MQHIAIGDEVTIQPVPWTGHIEKFNEENDEVFVRCSGCEGCEGHWVLPREIIPHVDMLSQYGR